MKAPGAGLSGAVRRAWRPGTDGQALCALPPLLRTGARVATTGHPSLYLERDLRHDAVVS
jgi:hypothetical protein